MPTSSTRELGPVSVHLGDRNGKYPDGNLVVVRGSDSMAVFDTPQVANQVPEVLADADLAILGHVHEDHMAGLHRMPHTPLDVHRADPHAARSFRGAVAPLRLSEGHAATHPPGALAGSPSTVHPMQ